jgi:hypothetical protein
MDSRRRRLARHVALSVLLLSGPAVAQVDPLSLPRLSLDVHAFAPRVVSSARLGLVRAGHRWRVSLECEFRNRSDETTIRGGTGRARLRGGKLTGRAGPLGGFVFDPETNRLEFEGPCPSGIANVGTGD